MIAGPKFVCVDEKGNSVDVPLLDSIISEIIGKCAYLVWEFSKYNGDKGAEVMMADYVIDSNLCIIQEQGACRIENFQPKG